MPVPLLEMAGATVEMAVATVEMAGATVNLICAQPLFEEHWNSSGV